MASRKLFADRGLGRDKSGLNWLGKRRERFIGRGEFGICLESKERKRDESDRLRSLADECEAGLTYALTEAMALFIQ